MKIQNIKEVGSKHIGDLAPEFTREMYGVKLTESQKKNPNDLGQPNLEILQQYIAGKLKVPVMENIESLTVPKGSISLDGRIESISVQSLVL